MVGLRLGRNKARITTRRGGNRQVFAEYRFRSSFHLTPIGSRAALTTHEADLFVLSKQSQGEKKRVGEGENSFAGIFFSESRGEHFIRAERHVKNENLYSAHALRKPSLGFTYIWMLSCQVCFSSRHFALSDFDCVSHPTCNNKINNSSSLCSVVIAQPKSKAQKKNTF